MLRYGFAKVSHAERASWVELVSLYAEKATSLERVLALVDARRGVTSEDLAAWTSFPAEQTCLVLTKVRGGHCGRTAAFPAEVEEIGVVLLICT